MGCGVCVVNKSLVYMKVYGKAWCIGSVDGWVFVGMEGMDGGWYYQT